MDLGVFQRNSANSQVIQNDVQMDEHVDRQGDIMKEWIQHELKRKVILNSDGKCFHCGKKATLARKDARGLPALFDEKGRKFHIDHLKSKCIGGETTLENLVISCVDCNQKKQRQTLQYEEEVKAFIAKVNADAPESARPKGD